jgi:tRNA(Arg) A34 adenosine deaminase TadA
MAEAIKMAESNLRLNKGGPFGAVVVKDGKIIARGANNVTFNNDPTAHAEIVAIRAACSELNNFQLTGCDIYCSCEPCPMCLGAIYWARPSRIFYAATREDAADAGFDDAFIYKELETQISDRKIETHQFLQQEARKILLEWNELNRKIPY